MKSCGSDADCGDCRVCEDGGCYMENGVPYSEQMLWDLQNVEEPVHTISSYALNELEVMATLGASIKIGLEYKLFRKKKYKTLWKWSDAWELGDGLHVVKMEQGLSSNYQDDCALALSTLENHQPSRITRPPNTTSTEEFLSWCLEEM